MALEISKDLKRKIRKDKIPDLATPSWDLLAEFIKAGKTKEALEMLDYTRTHESMRNNDSFVAFVELTLNYLATTFGEDELPKVLRKRYVPRMTEFLATTHSVEEVVQRCSESQRGHHARSTITEDADKYVIRYDPCGSGGRLRRTKEVGLTKQAHPWAWGKVGVPYYCSHCCINWEIVPIEMQGYPARLTLIGDKPEDPCIHVFYKDPEQIPEEYFTRVGMKKDLAKIRANKK